MWKNSIPPPPLLGHDPLSRALVRAWERRAELGVILQGTRRFLHSSPYFASRGVEQNPKVVEEAGGVLTARLSLMNAHLKDNEWLTATFSLADITLMVGIDFIAQSDFQLDPTWDAPDALARQDETAAECRGLRASDPSRRPESPYCI